MKETFENMENLVKSRYIEPEKVVEKKWVTKEDIDLQVEYCPESDITEDEFHPKEKFVLVGEIPDKIPETQEKEDEKSVKPNSVLVNQTQTQVILETQELPDIPVISETQTNVIVIND